MPTYNGTATIASNIPDAGSSASWTVSGSTSTTPNITTALAFTDYIFFSGFGFSIPSNETIVGIVVTYNIGGNGVFLAPALGCDKSVLAGFSTGVFHGVDKEQTMTGYTLLQSVQTRGASSDNWGWSPTVDYASANDPTFGFGVSCTVNGTYSHCDYTVDNAATMTITTTINPAVTAFPPGALMNVSSTMPVSGQRVF